MGFMETTVNTALWQQYGAAIDVLESAMMACPDSLWTERIWPDPPPPWFPTQFSEFWYVSFHTIIWLDLYLSGVPEEEFAPPAPFPKGELDSVETQPELPYTKEVLQVYLAAMRRKCHDTIMALTDEEARRLVEYPWSEGQPVSYLELQFYTMRHVQEHAAHLSLFLGQHGIPGEDLDWVARARSDSGSP
jgi:hypothetical protein